jgi:hypothetical protein
MRYQKSTIVILTALLSHVMGSNQVGPTFYEVDQGDGCFVFAQLAYKMDDGISYAQYQDAQAICDWKASFGYVRPPIKEVVLPSALSGWTLVNYAFGGFTPDASLTTLKPSIYMYDLPIDGSEYWVSRARVYNLSSLAMNPTTEEQTIIKPNPLLTL